MIYPENVITLASSTIHTAFVNNSSLILSNSQPITIHSVRTAPWRTASAGSTYTYVTCASSAPATNSHFPEPKLGMSYTPSITGGTTASTTPYYAVDFMNYKCSSNLYVYIKDVGNVGVSYVVNYSYDASTTEAVSTDPSTSAQLGSLNFGLGMLLVIMFLYFTVFVYNSFKAKKPWR